MVVVGYLVTGRRELHVWLHQHDAANLHQLQAQVGLPHALAGHDLQGQSVAFVHLCICVFEQLCICAFVHWCICAVVHLCICAVVHLCICAVVHLCICAFVCLSICAFAWTYF